MDEGDVRLPLEHDADDVEEKLEAVLADQEPEEAPAEGDLPVEDVAQTSVGAPVAVEESMPAPAAGHTLKIHPMPRPLPQDPGALRSMRFLSFENHSGFHNQRKSLVNALALAQLLDRTLLLPPARLGAAIPWEPDPKVRVAFSEECKAGVTSRPFAKNPNAAKISTGEECDDPAHWTYVGWDYLVTPSLLANRSLVDRWNASHSLFTLSPSRGGLGLSPSDIQTFPDPSRRSYQILDSPSTAMDKGLFTSRLELDDLRSSSARLLQFGSLFSGARLKFVQEENRRVVQEVAEKVILQNDGLDRISEKVRGLLGAYVAAHARVGDGNFKVRHTRFLQTAMRTDEMGGRESKRDAVKNMQRVFRKLAHDVFGLKNAQINVLLAEVTAASASPASQGKGAQGKVARAFGSDRARGVQVWDDEDDEEELAIDEDESLETPSTAHTLSRRAVHTSPPSRPLSPLLTCRSDLHDPVLAPHLAPFNTPLYLATDSRSPTTDAALRPFLRWFPCVFFLSDFEGLVEELGELVESKEGGGRWVSEWDQQPLARYLFPFLEAEIAARATEVVGTPTSTFSGYTVGTLHGSYVAQGMAATWE
ncbi:GDP-fucose protein O-fucosyltransferase family protein [Rhodotorula toruloides]|uniref:GDP-fucose protein O-fucosyltransferase family protein n=1 Tax=Rhodotorula toruloides TaxID=5286 RepID=A0A511KLE5_RHOTO|nr:GDP-fucose protein O-fucosyltransferase family protein [Rhodotorula toruloides]